MSEVDAAKQGLLDVLDITDLIRTGAAAYEYYPRVLEVGTVLRVGNGVSTLSGLLSARTEDVVVFPTGVQGMVLNLNRLQTDVILLGPDQGIQGGDIVLNTGRRLRVPVGWGFLGRVVDPLGKPLDGRGPIAPSEWSPLEKEAPGIIARQPVNTPLQTGIKIVDALVPLGRGQRELIIGDRQTGKTALALDTIINQRRGDVLCVYVAIAQKKSSVHSAIQVLRQYGAMDHTIIVVANPDDPPALRYLAPYAGCSMAEFFMSEGRDALIVYDDLTKHADSYRELSLLLRRPPGREAYPGDIFYLHARLLERACKLSEEHGGGSLTALPIVETRRGHIAAYIPTNLISISDGQIYLDADRFNRGFKPAVHEGLSVSRVGGAAQTHAMRTVTAHLRLDLSQFEEVAHFARLGTEVDATTRRQIARGQRLQAALKQHQYAPLSVGEQVIQLYAATSGYLDDLPVDEVPNYLEGLLDFVEQEYPHVYYPLERAKELDVEMKETLEEALEAYHAYWKERGLGP